VRSLGVAVHRRHPQYNERARVRARRLVHAAGVRVPRGVCISVFQLGYSVCERAWAILRRPTDRRRFPLRGKEKGPGPWTKPFDVGGLVALLATESSLLSSAGPGRTYAAGLPGNTHGYSRRSSARLSWASQTAVRRASRWLGGSCREM